MALCAPWATDADLCSPCNDYAVDPSIMDEYLLSASEVLFQLSGQQFTGECEQTIRPCSRQGWNSFARTSDMLYASDLRPAIVCGCLDDDSCSCTSISQLRLPRSPVIAIDEVKVDGSVLATSAYRLDDNQYLVRLDGEKWPCCQDLLLADTESDTWSVSYTFGRPPPNIGVKAAAILACELYMACDPETFEGQCRLPRNVIQVARQGVTVLVQSSTELFSMRPGHPTKTGIWEIDMFLRAFNPYGVTAPVAVLSPDLPPIGRRVDT